MILSIWQFLVGCKHIWETMDQVPVSQSDDMGYSVSFTRVKLRCTKCGNWKKKDLK